MRIGYARVSTSDQTLALQRDALKEAGCDKVFADHGVSGAVASRPGLGRAMQVGSKSGETTAQRSGAFQARQCDRSP